MLEIKVHGTPCPRCRATPVGTKFTTEQEAG